MTPHTDPSWDIKGCYTTQVTGDPQVYNKHMIFPAPGNDLSRPEDFASLGMTVTGMPALHSIRAVHEARPGIVTLNIAVPLEPTDCVRAIELIEQTRPVGVRVVHNLDCDSPLGGVVTPTTNADDDTNTNTPLTLEESGEALVAGGALFYPVAVKAVVVPMSAMLAVPLNSTSTWVS